LIKYESIINDYEEALMNNRKGVPVAYFQSTKEQNERKALVVFKYAIEYILGYDPIAARDKLDYETLEKLKLAELLNYINFPPEIDPKKDIFYIAWRLYPFTVNLTEREKVIRVYKQLLDGSRKTYPHNFFSGYSGKTRAKLCLQYLIEQKINPSSVDELYNMFASPNGNKILVSNKLKIYTRYGTPLEFLHDSLPKGDKNNALYHFYQFKKNSTLAKETKIC